MYIEATYYNEPPKRAPKAPRDRFVQYYTDLHERYGFALDKASFESGSQYKFSELGRFILDPCQEDGHLADIDLMVGAYWAHEFDPEYASCGPYFAYHYGFNCNMFDVLDQGSVCTFTALKLIQQYMKNGKANKVLCFAFDQSTIPTNDVATMPMPSKDAAAALILNNKKPSGPSLEVKGVELWSEHQLFQVKLNLYDLLQELLEKYDLDLDDSLLMCKRDSFVYRALKARRYQASADFQKLPIYFLPLNKGCVDSIFMIHEMASQESYGKKTIILIDEDVESLATGVLVINMPS